MPSSIPVGSLGSIKVKTIDSVLSTISTDVSTTEVISDAELNVTSLNDLTIESTAGSVIINSHNPVVFQSPLVLDGVISDFRTDSLKLTSKVVEVNKRDDATDLNASGSGLVVCGTDYAEHEATSGASGSDTSISVLWTKSGSDRQWTLKGGDLSFSKVLPNGEVCVFTFASMDSGDLVLKRQIGSQTSQMLSYWETL